jgi:uncharacterized protein
MSKTKPEDINPDSIAAYCINTDRAGPRLIVLGAVHGNERCGATAINQVLSDFARDKLTLVRGNLTLIPVANPLAYKNGTRTGDRNLNRNLRVSEPPLDNEDRIANQLCPLIAKHDALLDLHSFQSPGDPFVMIGPLNNEGTLEPFELSSHEEALAMRLGPRRFVEGWLDTYAAGVTQRLLRVQQSGDATAREHMLSTDPRYGIGTTEFMRSVGGVAITVECGQHDDANAAEVAYHAIINTMSHLAMIEAPRPAPCTDPEVLKLAEVTDRLHADDAFVKPWTSFDAVTSGEPIGRRHDGTMVLAPSDGFIVFPNTAALPGNEWFYFARKSSRLMTSD